MNTYNSTTVFGLIRQHAVRDGNSVAVMDVSGRALNYGGLLDAISSLHAQVESYGIGPRESIAVAMPDGLELAFALIAVSCYCTVAPLNPKLLSNEYDFYLRDLSPRAVMVLEEAENAEICAAAEALGIPVLGFAFSGSLSPQVSRLTEGSAPARMLPEGTALVLHTSGTTGTPKMVALTDRDLSHGALLIAGFLGLTPVDRCLSIMPLFHIHGILVCIFTSIAAGSSIACAPGFSAVNFFNWFRSLRPSWFSAVPTMHKLVLDIAEQNAEALRGHRLRFIRSGSSSLPLRVMATMEKVFGVPVVESYGMTEATPITYNRLPPGVRKPGTVGVAVGVELKIIDENGRELGAGETGEVAVRGPHVIRAYLDDPDDRESKFAGGWFKTGDQGFIDADGYLTIVGRLREIINRGGEKVLPKEVEDVLLRHNAVSEAAVFPVPHETLGEDVFAVVVPCQEISETDLIEVVAAKLSRFKVPRRILITTAIPKGPTGKVQRTMLARQLAAKIAAMPAAAGSSAGEVGRLIVDGLNSLSAVFVNSDGLLRNLDAGEDRTFEELGLDSLAVMELAIFIGEKTGIEISEQEIIEQNSMQGLLVYLKSKMP